MRALTAEATGPHPVPEQRAVGDIVMPLADRDLQLALWMLYELHYRGFDGVDPDAEWDPLLLVSRAAIERVFERAVRQLVADTADDGDGLGHIGDSPAEQVTRELTRLTVSEGPSDTTVFLEQEATRDEFVAYLRRRAVHHLRESDPHSFLLPRLDGAAKVGLAELQYDEYGSGRPDRLHQELFAAGLRSLDLPTDVSVYAEEADAATLASVNVMSLFSLNRRLRGAALGHLAAFEATSALPCDRIAKGAQRLGMPEVAEYYEEHVVADAVHEQLAIRGICGGLVTDEPELADDVLMGARACLTLDGLAGQAQLDSWLDARSAHQPVRAAG
ncbi:heme oxygenase-like protein [Nocardioides sp. J9]|uniref:iron-containing redox enzyme family protein n=1 Tax=Nocardioides sp. J9 TaxID=935844 RepID=UPI0011AD2B36|nr:iron-containing redox enzyme family protein [Nocardioides sp. J9]TWG96775.1 heme oxygenase-like protein [Nocardioides sp. J9]